MQKNNHIVQEPNDDLHSDRKDEGVPTKRKRGAASRTRSKSEKQSSASKDNNPKLQKRNRTQVPDASDAAPQGAPLLQPQQQPPSDTSNTIKGKSLCQLALENPEDKGLDKLLAYAIRYAYDERKVLEMDEFKATGATSLTNAASSPDLSRDPTMELMLTIVKIFVWREGLPWRE